MCVCVCYTITNNTINERIIINEELTGSTITFSAGRYTLDTTKHS